MSGAPITKQARPNIPVSVDLDDHWTYLRTRADARWKSFPSFLPLVVPRLLASLERHRIRATFFLVGQDAVLERNRDLLRQIAASGHEIGNHSFSHEPWLHLYKPLELREEIRRAHDAIVEATGVVPRGFRGPGYSLPPALASVLAPLGYAWDSSLCPNSLAPLARFIYLFGVRLSREEAEHRRRLGGTFGDSVQSIRPFVWRDAAGHELLEIPVTTMPGIRTPFHPSYIAALEGKVPGLGRIYFRSALAACGATGVRPSLVIHPTEVLGSDDPVDMRFFFGMTHPASRKIELLDSLLETLTSRYLPATIGAYASELRSGPGSLRVA